MASAMTCLEADHAGGQMNLSQPPITDLDGGADVHVRLGDRALAARMPVVGDVPWSSYPMA